MTFEKDFESAVHTNFSGRTIKAEADLGDFAVAAVEQLNDQLSFHYGEAQFQCNFQDTDGPEKECLIIGDESGALGDGYVAEFQLSAARTLVFISFQKGK